MDAAELQAAGYRRSLKVYVSKAGAAPLYVPPCWVRVRGLRVDIALDGPFKLEMTDVMGLTTTLDRCVIGWEEAE